MLINKEKTLAIAASKAGMDAKTARKYIKLGKLPSQVKPEHTWRTRTDPFEAVWGEALGFLENNAGLEVKSLFEFLQEHYPGVLSCSDFTHMDDLGVTIAGVLFSHIFTVFTGTGQKHHL